MKVYVERVQLRLVGSVYGSLAAFGCLIILLASPAAAAECPNQEIRERQASTYLPDCMAFEMVSPSNKEGSVATTPAISENGERVIFQARAALAETENYIEGVEGDRYLASRGADGWVLAATTPPAAYNFAGGLFGFGTADTFSADFGRWISYQRTVIQLSLAEVTAFEAHLDPSNSARALWSPISDLLTPNEGFMPREVSSSSVSEGVSEDFSHVLFLPGSTESALQAAYLPGDPRPTSKVDGGAHNVYVLTSNSAGEPQIALLPRDLNGKVWGGNCGAWVGGGEGNAGRGGRVAGAIAAGGTRIYFSARAGQAQPNPAEPGKPACVVSSTTNPIRIMQRLETEAGPQIEELFTSECTRVSPVCSTTNGDDFFEGASRDQTKVYFTTNRQLADSDLDTGASCTTSLASSEGCDLYLYDSAKPVGHRLTQVSAGEATTAHPTTGSGAGVVKGVTAISGDGSRAYFVASGVLTEHPNPAGTVPVNGQPNLYLYEAEGNRLSFIGTLAAGDQLFGSASRIEYNSARAVPMLGRDVSGDQVGGDGHVLVFFSSASLTANDTDGGRTDVYRYDSAADPPTLECVSCRPGGSDGEPFGVLKPSSSGVGKPTEFPEKARFVSEDGRTIVFVTAEPLTSGDSDGAENPFIWRLEGGEGHLTRLPAKIPSEVGFEIVGTAGRAPTVSSSGEEVAFVTATPLVGSDGDSSEDVYVARADGGFSEPPPPVSCRGEACQGPPSPGPGEAKAASSTFSGRGNGTLQPAERICPKGKKKVTRKGKTRCVKQTKHSNKRRASHDRGNAR